MKTIIIKPGLIKRKWYIINAANKILGRLATKLAFYLKGKHKTEYTPYMDIGDYIIVLNAQKITITGNKYNNKIYYSYSGYVGGLKQKTFKEMLIRNPECIIEKAVKGMLPKGPLGRAMLRKLKVYSGTQHHHKAQKPQILNI